MHEGILHGHGYGKLTLDNAVGNRRKTHEGLLNRIDIKRKMTMLTRMYKAIYTRRKENRLRYKNFVLKREIGLEVSD